MQRLTFPALALAALAASASAQISLKAGKNSITWPADCSTSAVLRNDTGVPMFDVLVVLEDDDALEDPELSTLRLGYTDDQGHTAEWDVDDSEDGDNDDASESDDLDSSYDAGTGGNGAGLHRIQALGQSDGIPNGKSFTLELCALGNSVSGRSVVLVPTAHSASSTDSGGDRGIEICGDPIPELETATPMRVLAIPHEITGYGPGVEFSFGLRNSDSLHLLRRVQIVPNDPDFDVINVRGEPSDTWSWSGHVFTFSTPIPPQGSVQLWMTLTNRSQQGPTTDVRLTRMSDPAQSYCSPKQNSQGCFPSVFGNGMPSVSSPQPFFVLCQQVINQKQGLLYYGFGPKNVPFQGGTMCVQGPTKRTQLQSSGGSPPPDNCSGMFAYDFNARIDSGADASLVAGTQIFAQFWHRDPASPSTTGLSNALRFVIDL